MFSKRNSTTSYITGEIKLNPKKHNIESLVKCFNYDGVLPQIIIDKIVDSYDMQTKKFSDITLSISDFNALNADFNENKKLIDKTLSELYRK